MNKNKGFFKGIAVGVAITIFVYVLYTGINIAVIPGTNSFSKRDWYDFMNKANEIVDKLDMYYYEEIDYDKMVEGMYYGLVASIGDPYTMYMDTERFKDFITDTEGSYAGIGVSVLQDPEDGILTIMQVFEGAPAEKAGLQPADKIIGVDGSDVVGMDSSEIIKMIKGPEDTQVTITVARKSEGRSFDTVVTRGIIEVPTINYKMMDNGIGYIKVVSFDAVTDNQFVAALVDLEEQGLNGLIIDLRNNPGGILDVALNITDLFIPEGMITYTIDGEDNKEIYNTKDDYYFNKPLTVLVNENSASASEIFTGAVKDYGVATVIGTTTFGKGLVQKPFILKDGSAVKVTISRYYTPNGNFINGTGIEPDMYVELSEENQYRMTVPIDEDIQLQAAVDIIKNSIQ